jgi:transcriptional regulator with XRE-family HTH domain
MNAAAVEPLDDMGSGDAYAAEHARLLRALGGKLRAERNRRDMSIEGLAEIANVHRTHLNAVELGLRDPRASMLLILADALKVQPDSLLEGLPVPRERKPATHCKRGWPVSGRDKPGEPAERLDTGAGTTLRKASAARPKGGDA